MQELVDAALGGSRRAAARLITLVERGGDSAETVIRLIHPHSGRAHMLGITGAPGAGKSTLVNSLAQHLRRSGRTVAIIAVDPSSPFTGGALLGDRVRMNDLYGDKGIFVRSMASRGKLGGLAQTTGDVAKVLDAVGFDFVLIETVGAGQAEVDVAATAHTTLVIETPGMGDDIQSIKAGILEVADILVVNKADRPGKENTVRALRNMLQLGRRQIVHHHGIPTDVAGAADEPDDWEVPIVETIATDGSGIVELAIAIDRHYAYLQRSGGWYAQAERRSRQEIDQLLVSHMRRLWHDQIGAEERDALVAAVARRELDPHSAANRLFEKLSHAVPVHADFR